MEGLLPGRLAAEMHICMLMAKVGCCATAAPVVSGAPDARMPDQKRGSPERDALPKVSRHTNALPLCMLPEYLGCWGHNEKENIAETMGDVGRSSQLGHFPGKLCRRVA